MTVLLKDKSSNKDNLNTAIYRLAVEHPYIHIDALKEALKQAGFSFKERRVKDYLYLLVKNGQLYSAGRGWYSTLPKTFPLDTKPVESFVVLMRKMFPLLTFSCWSLAQLQSWFHHLPAKQPLFVYTDRDDFSAVYDFLRDRYANCYLNPHKPEIQRTFRLGEETVIIRPFVSEGPGKGNFAPIEKILVDLYLERQRLELFDQWEYERLFKAIVQQYRINMAGLLRYANRRKIVDKIKTVID